MPLNIAILASGSGTNAQAIIDHVAAGTLDCSICLIAGNRPGAKVFERAAQAGIPHTVLDHTQFESREAFDAAMVRILQDAGAELIVLAGYMRLLSTVFLQAFAGRIINIHPALLPSFPGTHGGRDALSYGVKLAGCTVHFVEEIMDSGPIIIQAAVPVIAGETEEELMARIHPLEHRIFPQAIQWIAQHRLHLEGRTVHLAPRQGMTLAARSEHEHHLIWPPLEQGF